MSNLMFTHFPYCIKHVGNNNYIILNRDYKPLGTLDWVDDYEAHPSVIHVRITKQQAMKLSYTQSDDVNVIYLYKNMQDLLKNKKLFDEYLNRLNVLAHIKTK